MVNIKKVIQIQMTFAAEWKGGGANKKQCCGLTEQAATLFKVGLGF